MTDDPRSIKTLRAYYRSDEFVPERDPEEIMTAINNESDRSAVILTGSVCDDALCDAIMCRMRPAKNRSDLGGIFEYDGPLGSFSARIDMAHALGLIKDDERDALHVMRHMRNACAHSIKTLTFEIPELISVCRRLGPIIPHVDPNKITPGSQARRYFMIASSTLLARLFDRIRDELVVLKQKAEREEKRAARSPSPRKRSKRQTP